MTGDDLTDALSHADPGAVARLARFEKLHELWKDVPAEDILLDIGIALQLATYKHRQALILYEARLADFAGPPTRKGDV